MLAPMAIQHVPSLPPANPAPIDIHLDDDMNTKDTNTDSDATMGTSKTTTSPAPMSAGSTFIKTQTNTQTIESVTENTQPPDSTPAENQSASEEVKMDIDRDKSSTQASANLEPTSQTTSATPISSEGQESRHTTPTPAPDATSEDGTRKDNGGDTDARGTVTPSTKNSTETEVESSKPQVAEVKEAEVTKTESSIDSPTDQEPKLSNTEATEPMDLDVVDNSGGEVKHASSNEHDPNISAAEDIQAQGGSDHQQITSKDVNPIDAPLPTPKPILGASQFDDTTAEISRLHATYDSSGESRASERAEEKLEDDTVSGAQTEQTSSEDGKFKAPEPVVHNNSKATTFESTTEHEDEETTPPAKIRGSLFGGPDGKQIQPIAKTSETPRVDSVARTETAGGAENLVGDDMTDISPETNILLDQAGALSTEPFNFEKSNAEESLEPDVYKDIGAEAVLGAQREASSPPPSSDHDAKPDISPYSRDASPASSHATSNNSQESHKTSASQAAELVNQINSGFYSFQETDDRKTPEEFSRLEQASNSTDQSVLPSIEQMQPCNCEPGHHCSHRVRHEFNLRDRPECVYLPGTVVDNDPSGTYTNDRKYYPSTREVDWEDRDEDEDSIENGGHLMSGGLGVDKTYPMGRYSKTIPFNETDPLIRDKNPFGEESSSENESTSKKSKKRKNKGKSTREAKRPKITDMTNITDDPDTQPTHRSRQRSNALPYLSTTLGTLAESLRNRHSESKASKPTKKSSSKKKTKTTTTSPSQPSLTITQMVQRVAKPLVTKLSYPILFNCPSSSCSLCQSPSYALIGTGSSRSIKIYDFGSGNRELADAVAAGRKQTMERRPESTKVCLVCTTNYLKVLMCKVHDVVPLDVCTVFSTQEAVEKAEKKQCTKAELSNWCSLCPAPAAYACDKNCGAKFCDSCAPKVYAEDGNLTAMLDQTSDKVTEEYTHGLRADVELLRKGGELGKFLARMASSARRNRAG